MVVCSEAVKTAEEVIVIDIPSTAIRLMATRCTLPFGPKVLFQFMDELELQGLPVLLE